MLFREMIRVNDHYCFVSVNELGCSELSNVYLNMKELLFFFNIITPFSSTAYNMQESNNNVLWH